MEAERVKTELPFLPKVYLHGVAAWLELPSLSLSNEICH
jgi:hypothetical protein